MTDHTEVQSEPSLGRISENLREEIAERIVMGIYTPGQRLDERELAADFKVSRTPIREALLQLAQTGLVENRPRRGAVVSEIQPSRLCEMFDVMAELEAMCGRLAARRATKTELELLKKVHLSCEQAHADLDPEAYYKLNETYHLTIYQITHNAFLEEQCMMLHRRLRPYRRLQLRVRNRIRSSYSEHAAIVEAILAGNEDTAARALRDHVVVQGERFGDLVASLNELKG